jgi:hypothetical protein
LAHVYLEPDVLAKIPKTKAKTEKKPTAPKVSSEFSIKTARRGNGKLACPKTKPSQVGLRYEGKVEGRGGIFVAVQFAVGV